MVTPHSASDDTESGPEANHDDQGGSNNGTPEPDSVRFGGAAEAAAVAHRQSGRPPRPQWETPAQRAIRRNRERRRARMMEDLELVAEPLGKLIDAIIEDKLGGRCHGR